MVTPSGIPNEKSSIPISGSPEQPPTVSPETKGVQRGHRFSPLRLAGFLFKKLFDSNKPEPTSQTTGTKNHNANVSPLKKEIADLRSKIDNRDGTPKENQNYIKYLHTKIRIGNAGLNFFGGEAFVQDAERDELLNELDECQKALNERIASEKAVKTPLQRPQTQQPGTQTARTGVQPRQQTITPQPQPAKPPGRRPPDRPVPPTPSARPVTPQIKTHMEASVAVTGTQLSKSQGAVKELFDTEVRFHEQMVNSENFWRVYSKHCSEKDKPLAIEMLKNTTAMKNASEVLMNELSKVQNLKGTLLIDGLNKIFTSDAYKEYGRCYGKGCELQVRILGEFNVPPQKVVSETNDEAFLKEIANITPPKYKTNIKGENLSPKDAFNTAFGPEFSPIIPVQRGPRHKLLFTEIKEGMKKEGMKEEELAGFLEAGKAIASFLDKAQEGLEQLDVIRPQFKEFIDLLEAYPRAKDNERKQMREKILKNLTDDKIENFQKLREYNERFRSAANLFLMKLNPEISAINRQLKGSPGEKKQMLENHELSKVRKEFLNGYVRINAVLPAVGLETSQTRPPVPPRDDK